MSAPARVAKPFAGVRAPRPLVPPEAERKLTPRQREIFDAEMAANDGQARRRLLRTENYDLTNTHFDWVDEAVVTEE